MFLEQTAKLEAKKKEVEALDLQNKADAEELERKRQLLLE